MEGDSAGRGSANLQQTDGRAGGAARPDSLASIHYVSGAMGRPLGVEITHANLMHLIRWHRRAFRITAADIASQLTPPGHEAAIWEIWPYLAAGASLHFADAYAGGSARLLREWLTDEFVTMAFAPPGLAERLMALEWPRTTALRYLLTGGDVLRQSPPTGLPFAVVNHYGRAEATVDDVGFRTGRFSRARHSAHRPTDRRYADGDPG